MSSLTAPIVIISNASEYIKPELLTQVYVPLSHSPVSIPFALSLFLSVVPCIACLDLSSAFCCLLRYNTKHVSQVYLKTTILGLEVIIDQLESDSAVADSR